MMKFPRIVFLRYKNYIKFLGFNYRWINPDVAVVSKNNRTATWQRMEVRFSPLDERRRNFDEDSLTQFTVLETPRVES